jgi:hypothetical protein
MADNILSYFIKDLIHSEKTKYTCKKTLECIYIYYNNQLFWLFELKFKTIINYINNTYKNAIYTKNNSYSILKTKDKSIYGFTNKITRYNQNIIYYRFYLKSYFIKDYFEYYYDKTLIYNIIYYNMYIYKYCNKRSNKYMIKEKFNVIIFIPNKYEIAFCSKLFYIF